MKRLSGGWLARLLFAGVTISGLALTPARADVLVQIDKSSQRMAVSVDGAMRYERPVSTGRDGYGTPSGTFHPQSMARHYFSRKYYNAPMPHAIFFYCGFAIHGTNDLARLAVRPRMAAPGCTRRMRQRCSHWSSATARAARASRFRTSCRPSGYHGLTVR